MLIHDQGGLYLDIKSSIKRPIDEIIQPGDVCLLSQWKNRPGSKFEGWGIHKELSKIVGGEFQQWFMLYEPGHPFLKNVIKNVLVNIRNYSLNDFGVGRHGVLKLSGPIAYSLSIKPLLESQNYRIFDSEEAGIIYSIFPGTKHRNLFKDKYSDLKEEIICKKRNLFFNFFKSIREI
jgi:hypothetical protein